MAGTESIQNALRGQSTMGTGFRFGLLGRLSDIMKWLVFSLKEPCVDISIPEVEKLDHRRVLERAFLKEYRSAEISLHHSNNMQSFLHLFSSLLDLGFISELRTPKIGANVGLLTMNTNRGEKKKSN
jgi:hypothetical protein